MSRVARLLLAPLLARLLLALRRPLSRTRTSITLYGMPSARSLDIGYIVPVLLRMFNLLSSHGICLAWPAITRSLTLAGVRLPLEERSRRSPHAGPTLLPERLSRLPQLLPPCLRHPRLLARELEMSVERDTYLQDNLIRDIAILMSHRLRRDSPRARPKARAPRINSRTGDTRAKVPKIVLRLNIAIPIGTITIVVAGAVEAADGEDCSAARHREVMGRTGSAQQSPSLPHAEDDHAVRAIFMVGYVGFLSPIVPSSTSIEP